MLDSDDLEMVQLGAILLFNNYPLVTVMEVMRNHTKMNWSYKIEDDKIVIYPISSIWEQLNASGYKHSYAIDNFTLDTLTDAIKDFYNGKNCQENVVLGRHRDGESGSEYAKKTPKKEMGQDNEGVPGK